MYKKSVKENSNFLFPFLEGLKYYGSNEIEHGLGTMVVLNDEGDVLTCGHIAKEFIIRDKLASSYPDLIKKLNKLSSEHDRKEFEKKHNLNKSTVVLTNISLPFDIKTDVSMEIKMHDYLDIALLRFKNLKFHLDNYPIFAENMPEQGQSVCKLGFAFPEYSYFEYSGYINDIVLKSEKISNFPLFPMDGIVTRHIIDEKGKISMFETSSPGIRGQSGGPIFSPEGLIYGIQSHTKQLDLNFDINTNVKRANIDKEVTYTPFINLGVGVSSKEIIKFLKENNVKYNSRG
jgi:hypothetical protein